MKKRFLSIFLAVAMIVGLFPLTAKAETTYKVVVGNAEYTNSGTYCNGTLIYDAAKHTLTLNGYDGSEIRIFGKINIILADNTDNIIDTSDMVAGIAVDKADQSDTDVYGNITGSGNLKIINSRGGGFLVNGGPLYLNPTGNLTIDVKNDPEKSNSAGAIVSAGGLISITGGGNISINAANGRGIYAKGNINIGGTGSLSVQVSPNDSYNTYALEAIRSSEEGILCYGSRSVAATTPYRYVLALYTSGKTLNLAGTGTPMRFVSPGLISTSYAVKNTADGTSPVEFADTNYYEATQGAPDQKRVVYELIPPIDTVDCKAYVNGSPVTKAKVGELVEVKADPTPEGMEFRYWRMSPNEIISKEAAARKVFVMPTERVWLAPYFAYPGEISGKVGEPMDIRVHDVGTGWPDGDASFRDGEAIPGLDFEVESNGIVHICGTPTQCGDYERTIDTIEKSGSSLIQSAFNLIVHIDHNYQYAVDQKASFTDDGSKSGKCIACDKIGTATIPKAVASLSAASFTYNGKAQTPTVKMTGAAASEYATAWSKGRKNVGTYTATVTLKGDNYEGSKKLTYTINPKGTSISKLTKAKKAFTVKWKKQSALMPKARITGYQIQYALDNKFTKSAKTVTVKGYGTTSRKISKLKAKKKYFVRVRTYMSVSGKKYYANWSKTKYVTTK